MCVSASRHHPSAVADHRAFWCINQSRSHPVHATYARRRGSDGHSDGDKSSPISRLMSPNPFHFNWISILSSSRLTRNNFWVTLLFVALQRRGWYSRCDCMAAHQTIYTGSIITNDDDGSRTVSRHSMVVIIINEWGSEFCFGLLNVHVWRCVLDGKVEQFYNVSGHTHAGVWQLLGIDRPGLGSYHNHEMSMSGNVCFHVWTISSRFNSFRIMQIHILFAD